MGLLEIHWMDLFLVLRFVILIFGWRVLCAQLLRNGGFLHLNSNTVVHFELDMRVVYLGNFSVHSAVRYHTASFSYRGAKLLFFLLLLHLRSDHKKVDHHHDEN